MHAQEFVSSDTIAELLLHEFALQHCKELQEQEGQVVFTFPIAENAASGLARFGSCNMGYRRATG